MLRFLSTCWMKELRNPFALDRSPTFWHKNQTPDWAGLILGQNPPCKELSSSQMPEICPGGRKQINLFSTIWNPGKLLRCMRAGGRQWGCMVKKKKSTTNETLSQFVHCRKIKQLASWINVLWWDYDFDVVVVVVRSGEGACFQPYSMLRLQY